MNVNTEKYLPIGTVVLLKNGKKKLMIIGFCSSEKNKNNVVYDYSGCLYPEGLLSSEQIALFNHEQIAEIVSIGFSNNEDIEFKNKLKQMVSDGQ